MKVFEQYLMREMKTGGDWQYSYKTFAKIYKKKIKVNGWEFDTDYHAASLYWGKEVNGKLWGVYITPFYDDTKGMAIQIEDENGVQYMYDKKWSFSVTRDEEKDTKAYLDAVKKILTDIESKIKAGKLKEE